MAIFKMRICSTYSSYFIAKDLFLDIMLFTNELSVKLGTSNCLHTFDQNLSAEIDTNNRYADCLQ